MSQPEIQKIQKIKSAIIAMAQSFNGQGDPDYSKQQALEKIVAELLLANPQPPIKERLDYLYGTWKQVWGPYDYRDRHNRGVDPELGIEEIYQSVFPGGYYYNISPLYLHGNHDQIRIGLLRGKYSLDEKLPNRLNVYFTRYPGIKGRPADGTPIWTLAPKAEANTLENEITIVPWLVVRLFFGRGCLDEVYTDNDLRITYGSSRRGHDSKAIYIMTKV